VTALRSGEPEVTPPLQGVIKSYDPSTGDGVVVRDTDLADIELGPGALEGSVLRMVRQGQRVVFELDDRGRATTLRLGSEVDMGTPGFPREQPPLVAQPPGSIPRPDPDHLPS